MAEYDEIISLGSSCCPGLSLRKLEKKGETYPFDWIRTNSKIIYDVLISGRGKYIAFNQDVSNEYYIKDIHSYTHPNFNSSHINHYGQYFTHYTDITTDKLTQKFENYFDRFFRLLSSNKKVLFIHSNEEYIYHKNSRGNKAELYDYLCKINDFLEEKYPRLTFKIVNIDIKNNSKSYKNIVNLNMDYTLPFSDNCETCTAKYYKPYRNEITRVIQKYLAFKAH